MNRQTQCNRILEFMKTNGSITPMDAIRHMGCLRLSARIFDLKETGYDIHGELEYKENEEGEVKKYARYYLH